jgi:hypothetical protein
MRSRAEEILGYWGEEGRDAAHVSLVVDYAMAGVILGRPPPAEPQT